MTTLDRRRRWGLGLGIALALGLRPLPLVGSFTYEYSLAVAAALFVLGALFGLRDGRRLAAQYGTRWHHLVDPPDERLRAGLSSAAQALGAACGGALVVPVLIESFVTGCRWERGVGIFLFITIFIPGAIVDADGNSIVDEARLDGTGGEKGVFSEVIYFSYTTLSTLGYGDITAADPLAMTLANIEAIIGQFFIAILVARLVSLHVLHAAEQRSYSRDRRE